MIDRINRGQLTQQFGTIATTPDLVDAFDVFSIADWGRCDGDVSRDSVAYSARWAWMASETPVLSMAGAFPGRAGHLGNYVAR